jgi:hypothetical protein
VQCANHGPDSQSITLIRLIATLNALPKLYSDGQDLVCRCQLASISGKVAIAIVAQALIFGLGHAYEGLASVLAIILHGLILGGMAHWRGNIRAGIIEHAGWDLLQGSQ